MTSAKQLFEQGHVKEAASVLAASLRDKPRDTNSRTFLFELLCFSGQYDRAEKQLNVLADGTKENTLGAVLYFSALHGERSRHDIFRKQEFPANMERAGKESGHSYWVYEGLP